MNLGYIDPGTGSMLLQGLLGGLAAAAVAVKIFWRRILEFLHLSKPSEPEPAAVETDASAASEPTGKH